MTADEKIKKEYKEKFNLELFVKRLDELLKESELTQADIAKAINVDPNTISSWKVGRIKPPYKRITQIAHLFHVNPGYLYKEDAPKNLSEWSQAVSESYDKVLKSEYDKEYRNVPYKALIEILQWMGYVCFMEEDTDNNDKVRCVVYDSNTRSETYLDNLMIKKLLSGIESTALFGMKHNDRPDIPRK